MRRAVGLAAVGLAGVALVVCGVLWTRRPETVERGTAAIGGPFTLVDQRGRRFTDRDLLGRPSLIFFGFTYCPEACPTTLARLSSWMRTLGPEADRLHVVFVTIDPARDTPGAMARYLAAFDPRIVGLSGTQAQVDGVTKAYRVYVHRVPLAGGDYTMDHSAVIYALDRRGRFSTVLAYGEPDAPALGAIRTLLAS